MGEAAAFMGTAAPFTQPTISELIAQFAAEHAGQSRRHRAEQQRHERPERHIGRGLPRRLGVDNGPVAGRMRAEDGGKQHHGGLIVGLIAAVLGFGGIAGASFALAKTIFFVVLVLILLSLIFGTVRRPLL